MEKWICKACGYIHRGDDAPERCPQCGAPQSKFYPEGKDNGCAFSMIFIIITLSAMALTLFSCRTTKTVDNSAVKALNLNRYLGKWYEIARFDHRFERDMMLCSATYTMRDDGTITVENKGMKHGKWKTSIGRAKLTDVPGVLRVSFFRPFYSDYRVLMVAPDYSYALVGGSNDKYLWILSRTPQLDKETRGKIILEARFRGYKTENLVWVEQ